MKGKLTPSVEREEGCDKEGLGVILAFPPLPISAPFAGLPTASCWDRAFGGAQPPRCGA